MRHSVCLVILRWTILFNGLIASSIGPRLSIAPCRVYPLCTLGRGELDDDTISYNDIVGLRVDPYGEECGEWVLQEDCTGRLDSP